MDTDSIRASNTQRELQEPAHAPQRHKVKHRKPKPPAEQPLLIRLYTGVDVNPKIVAAVRALLGILLTGALTAAASYVRNIPPGGLAIDATVIFAVLTALQGWVDVWIKGDASAAAPKAVH